MSTVSWRSVMRQILDATFPPACAGCKARGHWLCPACLQRVERLPLPQCGRCGRPLESLGQPHGCRRGHVGLVCAAGFYAGPLREAVHALKYNGRHGIGSTLAGLLAPVAEPFIGADDVLVPVPLHSSRQRERGYNQAQVLAVALSDILSCVVADDVLRRIRPTPQQTGMSGPAERRANVRGAFEAESGALAGQRVWLVDDVYTTGATLGTAAQALHAAGVREVHGAVIARARS